MERPTTYRAAELGAIAGAAFSAVTDVRMTDGIVMGAALAYAGAAIGEMAVGAYLAFKKGATELSRQERNQKGIDSQL